MSVRERRHRRVSSHRDVINGAHGGSASPNNDNACMETINGDDDADLRDRIDPRIEKEIEHLSKMSDSGVACVILEDLRKKRLRDPPALDPRSSSRTPSASTEPPYKTRYESSVYACRNILSI